MGKTELRTAVACHLARLPYWDEALSVSTFTRIRHKRPKTQCEQGNCTALSDSRDCHSS